MHVRRECLSMIQVQRELGLSERHVVELIASRRLPAFRVLGRWRVERAMLDGLIDELYDESHEAVRALRRHDGRGYGEPGAAERSAERVQDDAATTTPADDRSPPESGRSGDPLTCLTDQQRRIARCVGSGMSNAEIATDLSIEVSTVKSHVSRILQRCAVRDREQLIVVIWRSGCMGGA